MSKYPAYIHKDSDGSASGFFPGVPGCYFAGSTLAECVEDGKVALEAHLEYLREDGMEIPEPYEEKDYENDPECQGGEWVIIEPNL